MPPPPPELADDLLAEIFLRLPPEDIACLLRASLVYERWRRILANTSFRRWHREIHRTLRPPWLPWGPTPRGLPLLHMDSRQRVHRVCLRVGVWSELTSGHRRALLLRQPGIRLRVSAWWLVHSACL
ncbi:unnamed protein product [Urochloa humidicola]